jgi:hypothetical protein
MQEINKLIEEIDQLQEQLSVCQESFFPDEEEIEALEESIKEKVGQLGNKMREKFYDLAAKRFRNAEKIQKEIDKCERFNEAIKNELEKREIDGESLLQKATRLAWYGLVGNVEKFFSPGLRMTGRLKNVLKFNNMWMTALNKREAELKAKNGGEEEAPAQESMDIKALLFDINTIQDELNIVKESFFSDDEEIEALEESLKEKVTEFGDKFNAKIYGAVCDIYRKPDGAINKKIAKVEKEIAKIEEVLKNREEERDRTTVLRIVKQSAAVAIAPWVYSIIINFSKNAQPSFLLKQTLRAEKILLSKLNQRKAELESKGGEEEAPAQESAGLEFELEFLDDEE